MRLGKKYIFFKDPFVSVAGELAAFAAGCVLCCVFYAKGITGAVIMLIILMLLLLADVFRLAVISRDGIKLYEWMKARAQIAFEDLERIESHAGRHVTAVLYGRKDMIQLAFSKALMKRLLITLGCEAEDAEEFAGNGKPEERTAGDMRLVREEVMLDTLFGKKRFVKHLILIKGERKENDRPDIS